jgi:hypothetical protein
MKLQLALVADAGLFSVPEQSPPTLGDDVVIKGREGRRRPARRWRCRSTSIWANACISGGADSIPASPAGSRCATKGAG